LITNIVTPIPSANQPRTACRITRQAVRDFLMDQRPDRPDLTADPDMVALVRAAMVFGATVQRDAELPPVFVKRTSAVGEDCVQCKFLKCDACKTFVSGVHLDTEYSGARGCYMPVARCHDARACEGRGGMRA
jgi:hypothetical protein